MNGWLTTSFLETDLSHYGPALDELKKQSWPLIENISSSDELENYISFFTAFDEQTERSDWQQLANKTISMIKDLTSTQVVYIFTAFDW